MDISYAVKQLDREIALDEARLSEKKASRETLYAALTAQEKAVIEETKSKILVNPPPPKKAGGTT